MTLKPVIIPAEYRAKWNIDLHDFYRIYDGDLLLSDTLYRVGGLGGRFQDGYALLIKYVEAVYDDIVTTDPKRKNHLESQFVIINTLGLEKVNFKQFQSPYLHGGLIYSVDSTFYNIETGFCYGHSAGTLKSKDFIFIDNAFSKDENTKGIMKINKQDGSFQIFK